MKKLLIALSILFASCATQAPSYLFKQDKYVVSRVTGNTATCVGEKEIIEVRNFGDLKPGDTLVNLTSYPVVTKLNR